MFPIRIHYEKKGVIRFLGHLDSIMQIQLALLREDLPLIYTQGFHPRIKTSFSPPLPLGMESECEYMDIFLERKMKLNPLKKRLQKELPRGIKIKQIESREKVNSEIKEIEYEIKVKHLRMKYLIKRLKQNSKFKLIFVKEGQLRFILGGLLNPYKLFISVGFKENDVRRSVFVRRKIIFKEDVK